MKESSPGKKRIRSMSAEATGLSRSAGVTSRLAILSRRLRKCGVQPTWHTWRREIANRPKGVRGSERHIDRFVVHVPPKHRLSPLGYRIRQSWREAKIVRDARAAVSGMDLSDGLYDGVLSLAGGTLGVELALDRLPCHPFAVEGAQALGVPLINLALCVGDWGLLYAMESSRFNELKAEHAGAELTEVGRFVDEPGVFAVDRGRRFKLRGFVNEHFRSRMEDEQSYIDRVRRHDALTPE